MRHTTRATRRRTPAIFQAIESLESRLLYSGDVRSVTGAGNNIANPAWGSAGVDLLRLAAPAYADGISSPALPADQSARAISNILNNQASPANPSVAIATIDGNSLSDFGYSFGQFMDHDLDLTPDGGASFPITVAATDPIGPNALPFTRSATDPATGTSAANPAQQITTVTSYLDLSQVYGSTQVVSDALRLFKGGLLKTSPGNMLPYDNTTYFTADQIVALNMANDTHAAPTSALFAAGDRRANENVELTALQTLFVRNHNQIAAQLQKAHPAWTDEQLYQEARKLNIAEYEQIIYNGWIPAVLGPTALPAYRGYRGNLDATISNEFSTVAFRFGHSLLSANIERHTNSGADIPDVSPSGSDISLAEDFFDPYLLNPAGPVDPLTGHSSSDIDPVLKAEADGVSQATDLMAVGDVRNLLFGSAGMGGEDLMARDVQRDRDNGIPDYNTLRIKLHLPPITSFSQITRNVKIQQELAAAYPGGVNTIDAFEGGLAEDHVPGSDVGPLFQTIMADQFTRLRDGDRFFYLNGNFSPEERDLIQQGNTLTKAIEHNSSVKNLQNNAFVFIASISGTVTSGPTVPSPIGGPPPGPIGGPIGSPLGGFRNAPPPRNNGVSGVTVELKNSAGNVVATTVTNAEGNYIFTQLSGPANDSTIGSGVSSIGTYTIVLLFKSGAQQTSTLSNSVLIFNGDSQVQGMDFNLGSAVRGT